VSDKSKPYVAVLSADGDAVSRREVVGSYGDTPILSGKRN